MSPQPRVLILSSHVAASRVGGGFQAGLLASWGYEPILAPTVLFGRHPGLGPPGGGAVSDTVFEGILDGIGATGVFADLSVVITGYFASVGQVAIAARALDTIRAANPKVWVLVDPIMGDEGPGLYLDPDAADTLAGELVTRANLVAPNAWELGRLSGLPVDGPESALTAARRLGRPVLASSIKVGGAIGVIFVNEDEAWMASHVRLPKDPKGAGDLLTARFVAERLSGAAPHDALATAVGAVAESVAGGPVDTLVESLA